jgi:energy-coupling factor transporter ATP-binding protein EcfA2
VSIVDLYVPQDRITALTHARIGIYGANGSGKTTFASTIPDTERVLYVSVDDENIRPVARLKHFRVLKLRRWNDLLTIYQALAHPQNKITTVVWDTWSRVQDLAVGKVCNYEPSDPARLAQYINSIPKNPHDWRGWGQVGALCSEWQRNFNLLPVHMLYLLQEQDRRREVEEDIKTGPRLTPEALKGIRDSLEVLGRLYVDLQAAEPEKNGEGKEPLPPALPDLLGPLDQHSVKIEANVKEVRRLFIGQHDRYIAKGPTHLLGRVITDPDWGKVVPPLMAQVSQ